MTTALRPVPSVAQDIAKTPNVSVGMTSLQGFELAQRVAKALATSNLVPKEYQGNLSNCLIGLEMAQRIGASPLMVLQNLVVVHGRPTWSSQFLIATFNGCGKYASIRYEFSGEEGTDSYGCRALSTELSTSEKLVGPLVTIGLAKKEGWYGRNGSKWQTMPEMMLRYRAAAWFVRTTAPELAMGLSTHEEMLDVIDARETESGSFEVVTDDPAPEVDAETGEITGE
jgi:hypothetical protein